MTSQQSVIPACKADPSQRAVATTLTLQSLELIPHCHSYSDVRFRLLRPPCAVARSVKIGPKSFLSSLQAFSGASILRGDTEAGSYDATPARPLFS